MSCDNDIQLNIITRKQSMMDSRLEEPEFRLLASVYAALGPDAVGTMRKHDVVGLC